MEEGLGQIGKKGGDLVSNLCPIAIFHLAIGMVDVRHVDQVQVTKDNSLPKSNIIQSDLEKNELPIPNDSHILVYGRDGPYLMEKAKWPSLTLPEEEENVEGLTQEETLTVNMSTEGNLIQGNKHAGGMVSLQIK